MSYRNSYFLLLLAPFIISFEAHTLLASDTEAGLGYIQFTCKNTSEYDLCVSTLQSDPTSMTADLKGLLTNVLRATTAYGADVAAKVTELSKTAQDPFLMQCYTDCSERYIDAVDQIDDSVAALDSKGFDDVVAWVNAAIADVQTCEAGFAQIPGYTSDIKYQSQQFQKLCHIILDITNSLDG